MKKTSQGFTLIELSIVLVIIGLIAGGVLVGQELIRASEMRGTLSQIEKYNSAVNTFRNKYDGIPGDLNYQTAQSLGFYNAGMDGGLGRGDGNGLIQDDGGNIGTFGETWVFWRHLSDANMIDGSFGTDAQIGLGGDPNGGDLPGDLLPPAKLGRGNYIMVYGANGTNYYQIQGVANISPDEIGRITNNMTPLEAQTIDAKIDDGLPMSGKVQAMIGDNSQGDLNIAPSLGNGGQNATDTSGGCTVTTSPITYDTGTAAGNTPGCGLRLQFN